MPLFLVGTPIGNLGDITFRALETLKNSNIIYCEDTRVSSKLLSHFEIRKPLKSFHVHSKESVLEEITQNLESGLNISYISDAGMPCISDPGKELVILAIEKGFQYTVIPGPSALDTAYAGSMFQDTSFLFVGFTNKKNRIKQLESLKNQIVPMIFYESPHRVKQSIEDMLNIFGNRKITIARELTKIHESYIHTDIKSAIKHEEVKNARGEFVLVVEGAPLTKENLSRENIFKIAKERFESGEKISNIAKEMANEEVKRQEIYLFLSDINL